MAGTCFVVMGFGKKTDFETGRTLDLNKSYFNVIKPAVADAGLTCIRADEIVHAGLIDIPMYDHLLNADVVIADLSTANRNAFYELGVRHALRPHTTIIIAEDGIKPPFPFDLSHIAIRQYHHMGDDIGYSDAVAFREALAKAIKEILAKDPRECDSPVQVFLETVKRRQESAGAAGAPATAAPADATGTPKKTLSTRLKDVDQAQRDGKWTDAKSILIEIWDQMKKQAATAQAAAAAATSIPESAVPPQADDAYIIQRLALVTYKSEAPSKVAALQEARTLLSRLEPGTSNDTETLGLWGAVHKRLWSETKDVSHLDEAVRAHERGFYLRNDYYNGINYAFLLNLRSAHTADRGAAIADFVQAQRVRREVLTICNTWLAAHPAPDEEKASVKEMKEYLKGKYWVVATVAEAYLGMGDTAKAEQQYGEAYAMAPEPWMIQSTKDQRAELEKLLVDPPLKYIKQDG